MRRRRLRTTRTTGPARRTVTIYANSHAVLRIVANNLGVFLSHCHIELSIEMGGSAALLEAPEHLVGYRIRHEHIDVCEAMNISTTGNALWSDAAGLVTVSPTVYTGSQYPSS
ncbi:Uu.00g099950.m01.CDS01 [Anthostomella pinea]|uniref:Uu.00g099950.m01.CDS01 n=1 Tax=Anthostomella pinea TaxID=933095 RepID=A0AAI8VDX0_9PEZI|nr:Uu.00g099950.m01.CDS01 [Anthostomella pinea]